MMVTLESTQYNKRSDIPLMWWTFPGGERNVRIVNPDDIKSNDKLLIEVIYRSSDDLIDMMLLVNAIRQINRSAIISLHVPYMPFARQDRVMTSGEPFALQIVKTIIESCRFNSILTLDAHSDVLAGMFEPGILTIKSQTDLWGDFSFAKSSALVSPDAGALKKIYKLAKLVNLPVIEAGKRRDVQTGEIVKTTIDATHLSLYENLYIIDDICDGGRTFIELAKVIRDAGFAGNLFLCVTHGIFSKGIECLDEVFNGVYFITDLRNNNV